MVSSDHGYIISCAMGFLLNESYQIFWAIVKINKKGIGSELRHSSY
jgi:hypothetical protein